MFTIRVWYQMSETAETKNRSGDRQIELANALHRVPIFSQTFVGSNRINYRWCDSGYLSAMRHVCVNPTNQVISHKFDRSTEVVHLL